MSKPSTITWPYSLASSPVSEGISRKLSIAPELGALVSELHDLFWPRHQQQGIPRSYSMDVTVEQVQQVCKRHGARDIAGA